MSYVIVLWSLFQTRGCSSNGRALALHARGTGFDTLHLQMCFILLILKTFFFRYKKFIIFNIILAYA